MPEMIPDYYYNYRKRGHIMGFTKKTWKNRIAEYINRRLITMEDGSTNLVTVARDEGTISQEGDAFNAANMNDLEDRIEAGFADVSQSLSELIIKSVIINQTGLYGYIKDCIGSVIFKNKTAFFHIEGEMSGTIDLPLSLFGLDTNLRTPNGVYGDPGDLKLLASSESQNGNKVYVKIGSNSNSAQISASGTSFYGVTFAVGLA